MSRRRQHPRRRRPGNEGYKAWQLCRQVGRTLTHVLGDSGDDVLRDLVVESVEPAPNASRLLVTVSSLGNPAVDEILGRLQRAGGQLRTEIAQAINRKRVPELAYRFGLPAGE